MAKVKRVGTLQIEQDIAFQRTFWKAERIGWVVFLVLLLLVALGFAGGIGPLNQATVSNSQLEVQYQPFARRSAPTSVEVTVNNPSGSTTQLIFQRDFINEYQIQKITPQPSGEQASEQFLIYEFSVPDGITNMNISFSLQPDTGAVGDISGKIGQTEDGLLSINQWVYP